MEPLEFFLKRDYFISKKYHRVLDYGSGPPEVALLSEHGYDINGVDLFSGEQLDSDEVFDTVLFINSLSLLKPGKRRQALAGAWSHVAPAGCLFVSTHDDISGADLSHLVSDLENTGYIEICSRTSDFPYIILTKNTS